jgi:hypothetical protein
LIFEFSNIWLINKWKISGNTNIWVELKLWKSYIQPGYLNFKNNIKYNILIAQEKKKEKKRWISYPTDITRRWYPPNIGPNPGAGVPQDAAMHHLYLPSKVGWSPILEPRSHWEVSWGNKNPTKKKCPLHTPSKHHPSTVVLVLFGPIWCCLKPVLHPRVHLYTGHFIAAGGPDLTWDVSVPEN